MLRKKRPKGWGVARTVAGDAAHGNQPRSLTLGGVAPPATANVTAASGAITNPVPPKMLEIPIEMNPIRPLARQSTSSALVAAQEVGSEDGFWTRGINAAAKSLPNSLRDLVLRDAQPVRSLLPFVRQRNSS